MPVCTKCGIEKDISEFRHFILKSNNKEYTRKSCLECDRAYARKQTREYTLQNPEKVKAQHKKRKEENREKFNANTARWIRNNRKRVNEYYKEYYHNNKDKYKEYQRARQKKNKDKLNANYSKYVSSTIETNFVDRCKTRRKIAKKKYPGVINKRDINKDTFREIFDKQNGLCPLTGVSLFLIDPYTEEPYLMYEVDHIIPLAKGGEHSKDNIQFVFPPANGRKGDKIL